MDWEGKPGWEDLAHLDLPPTSPAGAPLQTFPVVPLRTGGQENPEGLVRAASHIFFMLAGLEWNPGATPSCLAVEQ